VAIGVHFFAETASGVFHSEDQGDSWKRLSQRMDIQIDAIAVSGGHLFAGTPNSGVWRLPFSDFTTRILPSGQARRESATGPARLTRAGGRLMFTLPGDGASPSSLDVRGRKTVILPTLPALPALPD
jgi:hypothetical protein